MLQASLTVQVVSKICTWWLFIVMKPTHIYTYRYFKTKRLKLTCLGDHKLSLTYLILHLQGEVTCHTLPEVVLHDRWNTPEYLHKHLSIMRTIKTQLQLQIVIFWYIIVMFNSMFPDRSLTQPFWVWYEEGLCTRFPIVSWIGRDHYNERFKSCILEKPSS